MKGSEKQVAWAEDIKKNFVESAKTELLLGKVKAFDKLYEKIMSIEYAEFWIDIRKDSWRDVLYQLQKGVLAVRGRNYSNRLQSDRNFVLTETWQEIINDGKGGYEETFTKTW